MTMQETYLPEEEQTTIVETPQETEVSTEETLVPEPVDQDPPSKKLWKALSSPEYGQLYTKSYDEFKTQFSSSDAIKKLHVTLSSPEYSFYTKTYDEFENQFFPELKKKAQEDITSKEKPLLNSNQIPKEDANSQPPSVITPQAASDGSVAGESVSTALNTRVFQTTQIDKAPQLIAEADATKQNIVQQLGQIPTSDNPNAMVMPKVFATNPTAPIPKTPEEADAQWDALTAEENKQYEHADVFSVANEYTQKKSATKTKSTYLAGADPDMSGDLVQTTVPDDDAILYANSIKNDYSKNNVDIERIALAQKIIDQTNTPENAKQIKADLNDRFGWDRTGFERGISTILLKNKISEILSGHRPEDEINNLNGVIEGFVYEVGSKVSENTNIAGNQSQNIQITTYKGDKRDVFKNGFNYLRQQVEFSSLSNDEKKEIYDEFSKMASSYYGEIYVKNPEFLEIDPLNRKLSEEQLIAWRFINDLHPDEVKKFSAALIPDEDIKDNWTAQMQKQSALKTLTQIGVNLIAPTVKQNIESLIPGLNTRIKALNSNLYYYDPSYVPNQLKSIEEEQNELSKNQALLKKLDVALQDLQDDSKYGYSNYYERQNLLQEVMGQKNTGIIWGLGKLAVAAFNTSMGVVDMVRAPFLSEKEQEINMASLMGVNERLNSDLYVRQKNTLGAKMTPVMTPEFKAEIEKINNDPSLTYDQKMDQGYQIMVNNPDGIKMAPKGQEWNVTLNSLWYGTIGLAADLVPYLAIEYATGGGASGEVAPAVYAKFSRSFIAAFTTGYHQSLLDAYARGAENPYLDAMKSTTISAIAMAGAGTPDLIRNMAGTKTVVGKLINKMTDDEILNALRQSPESLTLFKKSLNLGKGILQSAWESGKGGTKFLALTTTAQAINDKMHGQLKDFGEYLDDTKIELLKFVAFGTSAGALKKGFTEKILDTDKANLFTVAQNPKSILEALQKRVDENSISKEDAEQIKKNVELASSLYKKMFFFTADGDPLSDRQKRDLLFLKMQEADLERFTGESLTEKLKKSIAKRLLDIKGEINDIYEGNYVIPEQRTVDVLTQGQIMTGDVIKNTNGEFGQVVQLNENGSVVVKSLNKNHTKSLWQADQIDVKDRYTPPAEAADKPASGAPMTPNGMPANTTTVTTAVNTPAGAAEVTMLPDGSVEASGSPDAIEAVDREHVKRQMKPITDAMVDIERQFQNEGYTIDWDYDNGIEILDKNGELVGPEELPERLHSAAAEYEKNTRKLGDFDQKVFMESLKESRQITDAEVVEVKPAQLPETITETVTYPTDEQIQKDLREKNFATFTYEDESQVPEQFRDRISSRGEINGKKFIKVTLPKSVADYELAKQNQPKEVKPAEAAESTEVKEGDTVTTTIHVAGAPQEVKGVVEKVIVDADGYKTYALKLENGTKYGTDEVTKVETQPTEVKSADKIAIENTTNALEKFDAPIKKGSSKTKGTELYHKAVELIGNTIDFNGRGWEAVSEAYHKALNLPKEKRTEQQNQLISSINEALGIIEAQPERKTERTADEEEAIRQKMYDEYHRSNFSYGQYGGKSSDTYYIKDKNGKVVKEIKIKNDNAREAQREVYKWIDSQAGTEILKHFDELNYITPEEPTTPNKQKQEAPTTGFGNDHDVALANAIVNIKTPYNIKINDYPSKTESGTIDSIATFDGVNIEISPTSAAEYLKRLKEQYPELDEFETLQFIYEEAIRHETEHGADYFNSFKNKAEFNKRERQLTQESNKRVQDFIEKSLQGKRAEQAPIPQVKEGTSVTFKDNTQQNKTGETVVVPGLEGLDLVLVKDGMSYKVHELSTGMEIADSGNAFSKEEAIANIAKQFEGKPDLAKKILGKIYEANSSPVGTDKYKVQNPSPAYESFAQQKEAEKSNLPYIHEEATRKEFLNLADQARKEGLESAAKIIEAWSEIRNTGKTKAATIEDAQRVIKEFRQRKDLETRKKENTPYPDEYKAKLDPSENALIENIQSGYTRDRWNKLPDEVKKAALDAWQKQVAIHNKYGYYPKGFSRAVSEAGIESIQMALSKYISALLSKDKTKAPERIKAELDNIKKTIQGINELYAKEGFEGLKKGEIESGAPVTKPEPVVPETAKPKLDRFKKQTTVAETPKGEVISETVVSTPSGMRSTDVQVMPLSELKTDESRFQNRSELNQTVVDDIANNWSDKDQDPIHVWTDPKDGKTYVLSGHHRYYGAQRAGRPTVKIIDRTNDFTEAQAIKFAKEEANANRSMETPIERARALRRKIENGDSKEEINKFLDREGKNRVFVSNLAALNPNGLMMNTLDQLGKSPDVQTQKETEQRADWIGEARRTINGLTDAHEAEMYNFLFDRKQSQRITTKADFLQKVRSSVKPLTPSEPLNLARFEYKTEGESAYESQVTDLKDKINAKQAEINAINERFTNPSAKDYIPTTSKDYEKTREIANNKIAALDAERKSLQKQLETLYSNKSKFTGGPATGSLFSVEKITSEDVKDMTDAVSDFIKESPTMSLREVQSAVAAYTGDSSPAMAKLVETAYNEAKNNATEQIVKDPVVRRLNRAFLKIDTQILENSDQLLQMARNLANARFNAIENSAGYVTRDGKPIGFVYDTDKVARERFDFSKLKKLGEGSDRVVFDLGNGKVLKVAKTARGLEQNVYEGDSYLSIVPEVYERGANYVVVENVPRIKGSDVVPVYDPVTGQEIGTATAAQMLKELGKFWQRDFDNRNSALQDVLAKYGLEDVLSYDLLYGDFSAGRNWGYKDGRPVHIDGGTFGGVQMLDNYRGKTNLSDPDFRRIYEESRRIKKANADTDKYTMFHYDENGTILGFTHGGKIYLNGEKITARTTAEESGHIWINNVKDTNPNLYRAGLDKVANSKYYKDVAGSSFYTKEAEKQGAKGSEAYENYLKEEALAKAIADQGAKFVTDAQKADFKNWVTAMWRNVIKAFGIKDLNPDEVGKLTLEEFARMAAADVYAKEKKGAKETKTETTNTTTTTNTQGEPTVTIRTKHPYLYTAETQEQRTAGLMRNILESENVSDETKEEIKAQGITKYKVASNSKAAAIADEIIATFGKRDALTIARGKDLHPSIRSAVFARLIDAAYEAEQNAKTPGAKLSAAQEWKNLTEEYSNELTAGGQFTAYAGHYYRISPMGFVMKENAERQQRFDDYMQNREKTYDQLWEELNSTAAGASFVETKIEDIRKKERKEERAKRDKNIDDFFDNLKVNPKNTYGFIIPPQVLNPVIEGMRIAVKAGDRVVDIVQKAINDISAQVGDNWDKEKFRKDYEDALTRVADGGKSGATTRTKASYEETLRRRQAELERRMREGDYSAEEYKENKTLSDKEQQAKDDYEETKRAYNELRKQSPEWQEKKARQFLDKFRDRLAGLSEAKRKEIISRSIKKLAETGALNHEDFRKIVAETMGFKELTPEDVKEIEGLVNQINGVESAEQNLVNNPTEANLRALDKAREDAMEAAMKLRNKMHRPADFVGLFNSLTAGNLLSAITLFTNAIQNISLQSMARFPTALYVQAGELGAYGLSWIGNKTIGSKIYQPTRNIILAQKGYFGKGKQGARRGWFNFYKGVQERDYFGKTSYQSTIDPKNALKDIRMWRAGEKYLTKSEIAERYLRASLGWQPDFILRAMSLGDKPQRWAAEGASAIQIARLELNLVTDADVNAFMAAPKAYATKILTSRGMNKEDAIRIATEYEDRIINAGSKAVMEQENLLSIASKAIDQKLKVTKEDSLGWKALKGGSAIIKGMQYPFVKIPANVYWTMYKIANPEVSMAQALYHSGEAIYYAKKGDRAAQRRAIENMKDSLGMAAYAYSIKLAIASLVASGYVSPPNDEETTARERAGEVAEHAKGNQINIGRLMGKGDYWVDLKWFGPIGTAMGVEAKIQQKNKQLELKGEEVDKSKTADLINHLSEAGMESMNDLVFNQSADMIAAIKNGGNAWNAFASKQLGTVSNWFTGATVAAITKASLPYEPRLKAESTMQEINNNMKYRNFVWRLFAGQPPAKVSIWGDKIKRDNTVAGVVQNLLGFSPSDPNQFGAILLRDFMRTQDPRFFPMPEDNKISVEGKQVELSEEEKSALETFVGNARKTLVQAFVYDMAMPYKVPIRSKAGDYKGKSGSYYQYANGVVFLPENSEKEIKVNEVKDISELPGKKEGTHWTAMKYNDPRFPDSEKVNALEKIYNYGREVGEEQFRAKFPAYAVADINAQKMVYDAQKNVWGLLFKLKMQSIATPKGSKAPPLTPEEQKLVDEMKQFSEAQQAAENEVPIIEEKEIDENENE